MDETVEHQRLRRADEHAEAWRAWGPYLSERAWGTVREDYSEHGAAWDHFPHDHARSRVYRWNEEGLAGLCDDMEIACVVEGVETRAQLDSLRRLGCDFIQGYYFAKPMPVGAIGDYLASERQRLDGTAAREAKIVA